MGERERAFDCLKDKDNIPSPYKKSIYICLRANDITVQSRKTMQLFLGFRVTLHKGFLLAVPSAAVFPRRTATTILP